MDIDGNNLVQLTSHYSYYPDVSPDGRWVVYTSVSPIDGKMTLGKVSIDGGDTVQLTSYLAQRPFYSPDGQSIACRVLDDTKNSWVYSLIPGNGDPPTRQFNFPGFQYQHLNWTPDGRYISFIGTPPDPSNIWLQPLAGGEPHQLTNFKSDYIFRHVWSRDGRTLTLVRGRGTSDVVLMRDTK
jgi:Tol biopolymer transport system component